MRLRGQTTAGKLATAEEFFSWFGAGRFIIVGLDQQPPALSPAAPAQPRLPGRGGRLQLGPSPATLSPLAQPHPSRDPLAFLLAFCPFGPSQSWARATPLGAPEDPRSCPPKPQSPSVAEMDSQPQPAICYPAPEGKTSHLCSCP